jgi:hypothetical protein
MRMPHEGINARGLRVMMLGAPGEIGPGQRRKIEMLYFQVVCNKNVFIRLKSRSAKEFECLGESANADIRAIARGRISDI